MIQAGRGWAGYHRAMPSFTVCVTGAASGIGRCTALHFAGRGARVIAADIDEDKLATLVREAPALVPRRLDVRREDDWDALAASLADDGLDVLVNNAGIMQVGWRIWEEDDATTQRMSSRQWGVSSPLMRTMTSVFP